MMPNCRRERIGRLRRVSHREHGIALIECLIAILIFAVGIVGLMGIEARVVNTSTASEDRGRAALLASDAASLMWTNNTVSINGLADFTALNTKAVDPTQGGLPSGLVTVTAVAGTTNTADIIVTWTSVSDSTPRTLTTRVVLP